MDDLLADFIAETREMLEALSGEIVAWEADPTDRARLDTIFRFVHTVKGNCGFFDFPRLERLSHAAEDVLAECRAGRREADHRLVSSVLAVLDRIGELTDAIEAGENIGKNGDGSLIAALGQDEEACEPTECQEDTTSVGDQAEVASKAHRTAATQRSIRLPVSLLDEVMKSVSDLVLARNDLARRMRQVEARSELDQPFDRLSGILTDVRDAVTQMRMQRLEHLFGSFPRLVRDLANDLGKQVMVDLDGGDVELDREMIEIIRDPLTHIIRNSVDHGIETPGERQRGGKREIGMLRFDARQAGNQITLAISDDGRGIDTDRLAAKAVAAGLHSQGDIDAMSDRERLDLMFLPGLSTANEISSVSGRGVGMDVVRANIEKVGGSIDVTSLPGQGTTFHLKLPLTLSIISAITIASHDHRFAVPRSFVEEITFGSAEGVEFVDAGDNCVVTLRGRRIPCLSLDDILGLGSGDEPMWEDKTLMLVRLATDDFFALAVDQVLDHEDVVVKPIAPAIMRTGLYSGTTLLEDGRPMMLLDVPSIAAMHLSLNQSNRSRGASEDSEIAGDDTSVPAMVFTAIDGRRRAIRLELVKRIDTIDRSAIDLDEARAQVVVDGRLLPLEGHLGGELPHDTCRLLRLSDGERELAYVVREVVDTVDIGGTIVRVPEDSSLEGIAMVEGRPLPLLDGHAMFARLDRQSLPTGGLRCRIPGDSDFARAILAPLLTNAGYCVVDDIGGEADVSIVLSDEGEPGELSTAPVLRLRPTPGCDGTGSIYRYDRDGLLAALQSIALGGLR